MKLSQLFFILFLFSSFAVSAQVTLPYSINKEGLPSDTSKLMLSTSKGGTTPGFFAICGIPEGQIAPDFILYDTDGKASQLSKLLSDGKPVLLIAASFTCPKSRKSIKDKLHSINGTYGDKINIRIIYTIDAHPVGPDICPYTGAVFTTSANIRDSVLMHQPNTYAQRKEIAGTLIDAYDITVPVLIDSPSNAWWLTYGPAPNNAYLISPRGVVYKKYAWLESIDFRNDIGSLLNDKRAMKTNVETEIAIEKDIKTGKAYLHVKDGSSYIVNIRNASGELVYNENVIVPKFDLSKARLLRGQQYVVHVKTSGNESYCLPYRQE